MKHLVSLLLLSLVVAFAVIFQQSALPPASNPPVFSPPSNPPASTPFEGRVRLNFVVCVGTEATFDVSLMAQGGQPPYTFFNHSNNVVSEKLLLPKGEHLFKLTDSMGASTALSSLFTGSCSEFTFVGGANPGDIALKLLHNNSCPGKGDGEVEIIQRNEGDGTPTYHLSQGRMVWLFSFFFFLYIFFSKGKGRTCFNGARPFDGSCVPS
jgi:hypothetical protein